ncbi:hypothetical protein BGZ47_002335 [Haplosporangium gracile]|nr:hypothetical protein BGZ47_002335 [Haplosporangium gracile]
MKSANILGAFAVCVNAACYVFGVQHLPDGAVSFRGNLRYLDNYRPVYKDRKDPAGGARIMKGDLGANGPPCPDTKIRMGLYFPHAYSGTISELRKTDDSGYVITEYLQHNMPQKPTAGSNKQTQQGSTQTSGGPKMTSESASRIQSAADRNPGSTTASSGFKERAQSSAAKNTSGKN